MPQIKGFNNALVISFESRHAKAMEALIQKHGGRALVAPSMKEVPLEENSEALRFGEKLFGGEIDILILLTGVGTRTLVGVLKTRYPPEQIKSAFQKTVLVVRGPKPAAALTELGLRARIAIPEPNTWQEILTSLDANGPVKGQRIAVQEYGVSNPKLLEELRKRGAIVLQVPVYRWALPDDTEPLKKAIQTIAGGQAKAILWTNAQQVNHVLQVARLTAQEDLLREGMRQAVTASIGPTCSETLRQNQFQVDFEPKHSKMAALVSELAERIDGLLKENLPADG